MSADIHNGAQIAHGPGQLAATPVVLVISIRPVRMILMSLTLLSLFRLVELLQTRMVAA